MHPAVSDLIRTRGRVAVWDGCVSKLGFPPVLISTTGEAIKLTAALAAGGRRWG